MGHSRYPKTSLTYDTCFPVDLGLDSRVVYFKKMTLGEGEVEIEYHVA